MIIIIIVIIIIMIKQKKNGQSAVMIAYCDIRLPLIGNPDRRHAIQKQQLSNQPTS